MAVQFNIIRILYKSYDTSVFYDTALGLSCGSGGIDAVNRTLCPARSLRIFSRTFINLAIRKINYREIREVLFDSLQGFSRIIYQDCLRPAVL